MLSLSGSPKVLHTPGAVQPGLNAVTTPEHGSGLLYFPLGQQFCSAPLEARVRSQGNVPRFPLLPAGLESLTCFPTAAAAKRWRYLNRGWSGRGRRSPLMCPQMCNFISLFCEILLAFSLFSHGNMLEHMLSVLREKNHE